LSGSPQPFRPVRNDLEQEIRLVNGDQTISPNGSANQILVIASVGPVREGMGVAEKPNKTDIFGIGGNQRG